MAIKTTEGWVPNEATERIMARVRADEFVGDIDWDAAIARLCPPEMPDYVRSSIHGLPGGYGTPFAAATWDAVVKEIFKEYVEEEPEQRDRLTAMVDGTPRAILDLACGTGESTAAWRRRFRDAHITAVDVSPYMLAVAERKFEPDWRVDIRCADGESLPFPDASFDLVTASLLFHEVPREVTPVLLAELHRVCAPAGQIAVMEPYGVRGKILHPIPFPEPYLKDFLETDWDAAFEAAGFSGVRAVDYGEGWMRVARKPE